MYVKIEPSGCCENKGMVQIRFCMYLDEKDYGYKIHHVQLKDGTWRDNPFHNHFILVDPETTEEEILDIAEAFLHEAYIKWASDIRLDLANDSLPFVKPTIVTPEIKLACESKVKSIVERL